MVANVVEVFGSRIAEGNDVQAGGQGRFPLAIVRVMGLVIKILRMYP